MRGSYILHRYRDDPHIRTDRSKQTFYTQSDSRSSSLIMVYTFCHSISIFWTHYCAGKPFCSNFRIITAIFFMFDVFGFLRYFTLTLLFSDNLTRGPWATKLAWMYSYEGYIQPKYCKCCMQEKLTFHLPWHGISSLDLIHMVVRGLLKEHYCKAFVKICKVS